MCSVVKQAERKNMELNRRDFLGLAASGAGAIVATSALPAFGKDDPSLFPKRGVAANSQKNVTLNTASALCAAQGWTDGVI